MSRGGRLRLHCRGVVQGVGFRPAVHRLARRLGLAGSVANVAGAVRIELEGEPARLERFLAALPGALPAAARLDAMETTWLPVVPGSRANGVRIVAEPPRPLGVGLVAPALAADRAPCPACLAELEDPADRRFGYPFISCSVCGPRYSIATAEPYARAHTTLAAFPLCPACRREFEDPADRRFHAESIACPACGPRLALLDGDGRPASGDPLAAACELLHGGGILALQGVGGFQLLVDAANPAAVERLRWRKRRPAKPFALLVSDLAQIEPHGRIDAAERALLSSPAAPIVLLRRRPGAGEAFPGVAPGSPALGVMLPASPLHHLLARRFGGPLVATSGNPSGEPLCTAVAEAVERLGAAAPVPVVDAFLVHDRPIARPLDDSVAQVIEGRPVLLRRARGFAPEPLRPATAAGPVPAGPEEGAVVAMGGDLKSAPALARDGRIWLAPHLGDLAEARVLERLRRGLAEIKADAGGALAALACDGHPGYLSHQLVEGDARTVPVPHHLAHGLAVMAEHGLPPPLAVVALDGLGFGPGPGHRLWGGEVLRIDADGWRRLAGLRPFPLPGGERAMGEPRRAALGLLAAAWGAEAAFAHPGSRHSRDAFAPAERDLLLRALAGGCNAPLCSSAGRLFDAAASLLGLVQVLSHEGEGGLRLEGRAAGPRAAAPDGGAYRLPLSSDDGGGGEAALLDWGPLLTALLDDIAADTSAAVCAARFHRAVAEGFATAAQAALAQDGPRRVALGGGCFQNRLLLEETLAALRRRGLEPFWNRQVPPSDGGLALGQVWGASHPALVSRQPLSDPQPAPITEEETHRRGAAAHVSGRRRSHPRDRGSAPRRGS